MSEERTRILQMISEGTVSAEQGAELLKALRTGKTSTEEEVRTARWFRVLVTDLGTERIKVNVNLPLSLINIATKMGARFSPNIGDVKWEDLMKTINEGAAGKLVELEDDEGRERFEIFVE